MECPEDDFKSICAQAGFSVGRSDRHNAFLWLAPGETIDGVEARLSDPMVDPDMKGWALHDTEAAAWHACARINFLGRYESLRSAPVTGQNCAPGF